MSSPRAATSVATSVSAWPREKRSSERVRCDCVMSPCSAATRTPRCSRRVARRLAPRLVRTNTSASSRSAPSTSTRRSSFSSCRVVMKRCSMWPISASGVWCSTLHRVARVAVRDAVDLAVQRGREEERLALLADEVDDAVDGRAEAQVEHAVGLVEHEQRDRVEAQRGAARSDPRGGRAWPPGCASARPSGPGRGCRRRRRRWRRADRGSARAPPSRLRPASRARGWAPARGRREPWRHARCARPWGSRTRSSCRCPWATWRGRRVRPARRAGRAPGWGRVPRCRAAQAQRRRARTRQGRGRTSYSMFNSWPSMRPVRGLRNRRAPRTDQEERRATSRSGTFRSWDPG